MPADVFCVYDCLYQENNTVINIKRVTVTSYLVHEGLKDSGVSSGCKWFKVHYNLKGSILHNPFVSPHFPV
jgi:hypothetical protein